jgi:hypothetical protein
MEDEPGSSAGGTVGTSDSSDGNSSDSGPSDTDEPDPVCEQYQSSEVGPSVTLTIRNESSQPVFFRPDQRELSILSTADDTEITWMPAHCTSPCEELLVAEQCYPEDCPDGGIPAEGVRLEVDGALEYVWRGAALETLQASHACAPGIDCQHSCYRREQAPAGGYVLATKLYRSCVGDELCECDSPDSESCELWDWDVVLENPEDVSVVIDYPTDTNPELVIVDP